MIVQLDIKTEFSILYVVVKAYIFKVFRTLVSVANNGGSGKQAQILASG